MTNLHIPNKKHSPKGNHLNVNTGSIGGQAASPKTSEYHPKNFMLPTVLKKSIVNK
ncbi:UNKNOWN [Stylonychia lemnae]|uniref:Uncharacterized protein n=1 Tax=Stylonychia lemnae TaxID=5949 RepID=A0A077ZV37_STYLE|nr:UNKNOWN [Stylonychia lemnae]|eukprot:CDW73160.1 UNKNOWN [Stylonychia lemnae]